MVQKGLMTSAWPQCLSKFSNASRELRQKETERKRVKELINITKEKQLPNLSPDTKQKKKTKNVSSQIEDPSRIWFNFSHFKGLMTSGPFVIYTECFQVKPKSIKLLNNYYCGKGTTFPNLSQYMKKKKTNKYFITNGGTESFSP